MKFHAQLSRAWKKFHNLGAGFHLPRPLNKALFCRTVTDYRLDNRSGSKSDLDSYYNLNKTKYLDVAAQILFMFT